MLFRTMVTCETTRKVKFDLRSSQISLQSIDDISEFTNRTIGRASKTDKPPPAIKSDPKFSSKTHPE